MKEDDIRNILVNGGLNEDLVRRLIRHYKDMRFYLSDNKYEEAGLHVGKFCENAGNIILDVLGQPIEMRPQMEPILQKIESYNRRTNLDPMVRITIPRFLRAAYEMRSKRDAVHVNLEISVNKSDSHVAVHICSWILSELLRVYGQKDMDKAAEIISFLSKDITPYLDDYEGKRLVMSNKLSVSQEILVQLLYANDNVPVKNLIEWIPKANANHIRTCLRQLEERRYIHYNKEKDVAKITILGINEAKKIIEEFFNK